MVFLDPGANTSIIHKEVLDKLGITYRKDSFPGLKVANGSTLNVDGFVNIQLSFGDGAIRVKIPLELKVCKDSCFPADVLLGRLAMYKNNMDLLISEKKVRIKDTYINYLEDEMNPCLNLDNPERVYKMKGFTDLTVVN